MDSIGLINLLNCECKTNLIFLELWTERTKQKTISFYSKIGCSFENCSLADAFFLILKLFFSISSPLLNCPDCFQLVKIQVVLVHTHIQTNYFHFMTNIHSKNWWKVILIKKITLYSPELTASQWNIHTGSR